MLMRAFRTYILPKLIHAAARIACDSGPTCQITLAKVQIWWLRPVWYIDILRLTRTLLLTVAVKGCEATSCNYCDSCT